MVTKFDSFTIFAGESGDDAGAIGFKYRKEEDDESTSTFLFLVEGVKEEEIWIKYIESDIINFM